MKNIYEKIIFLVRKVEKIFMENKKSGIFGSGGMRFDVRGLVCMAFMLVSMRRIFLVLLV